MSQMVHCFYCDEEHEVEESPWDHLGKLTCKSGAVLAYDEIYIEESGDEWGWFYFEKPPGAAS